MEMTVLYNVYLSDQTTQQCLIECTPYLTKQTEALSANQVSSPSLCYNIPAASCNSNSSSYSVVISPY